MNDTLVALFRIPASPLIGILRKNVGMNRLPPWHFIVLAVPFFAAYGLTKMEGFLWCGALTVFALLIQGSFWLTQAIKGERVDPDAVGTSMDGETDSEWREFGEPFAAIFGGGIALYYHQWIFGVWLIFAGICLAVAENLESNAGEFQILKPSWLPDELPELTRPRIIAAFAVAAVADLIQMPITFAENTGLLAIPAAIADVVLDLIAMCVTTWLIGFHWVLLPSFMAEAVPELDALPTWTGCVAFVIWRRKQADPLAGLNVDDDDDDETLIPATSTAIPEAVVVETTSQPPAQLPPPSAPDVIGQTIEQRLQRLDRLHEAKVITPEEYEAKRRKIVDEL